MFHKIKQDQSKEQMQPAAREPELKFSDATYQGAFTTYFTPFMSYILPFMIKQLQYPPDNRKVEDYIKETDAEIFLHDLVTFMSKHRLTKEWEEYLVKKWGEVKGEGLEIRNARRLKCEAILDNDQLYVKQLSIDGVEDTNSVKTISEGKKRAIGKACTEATSSQRSHDMIQSSPQLALRNTDLDELLPSISRDSLCGRNR